MNEGRAGPSVPAKSAILLNPHKNIYLKPYTFKDLWHQRSPLHE